MEEDITNTLCDETIKKIAGLLPQNSKIVNIYKSEFKDHHKQYDKKAKVIYKNSSGELCCSHFNMHLNSRK